MSRTDVHRPQWVLERDPWMRRDFVAYHDHWVRTDWDAEQRRWLVHRPAPCDLEVRLTGPGGAPTRCGLNPRGTRRFCSCPLCSQQAARKLGYRQERTWWRKTRTNLLAAIAAGNDAPDVPPFRSTAW